MSEIGTVPQSYEERIARINQLIEEIAGLMPPLPPAAASTVTYVRRRQGVSDKMIEKAITTHDADPQLHPRFDAADARDTLAVHAAFRPVCDRMKGVITDCEFMLDARRAKVGAEVLEFYQVAKTVAERSPDAAEIAEHVKNMAQELRGGRKTTRKTAAAKAAEKKEAGPDEPTK